MTTWFQLSTDDGWQAGDTQWNQNIGPNDKQMFLANNAPQTNAAGIQYVAYNWVSTPGVSKFGEYQGQSATHEITTGFEPAQVVKKYTSSGAHWVMTYADKTYVYANLNFGEGASNTQEIQLTETGFKLVGTNHDINAADERYVYAAWAKQEVFATALEDANTTDNTLLVDGGKWDVSNQSEVWSDGVAGGSNLNGDKTEIANGNPSTTMVFGLKLEPIFTIHLLIQFLTLIQSKCGCMDDLVQEHVPH